MVVHDATLVAGRAAGRLDAADESSRGERVQGFIHGLKRDVAHAITHPGGDRLGVQVVAAADGLEQCDARRRHPQAGTAQLLGDARRRGHDANPTALNTNDSRKRTIRVKHHTSNRWLVTRGHLTRDWPRGLSELLEGELPSGDSDLGKQSGGADWSVATVRA